MVDVELVEQVMRSVNNWFVAGRESGTFTVSNGALMLDVQNGRFVRVVGSVFNDGLHRAPFYGMTDETFEGEVCLLSVPRAFLRLVEDISDWLATTADARQTAQESKYASESFGGYTYQIRSDLLPNSSSGGLSGWELEFSRRLNEWRKL